jgi:hypothetical protein
MRSVRWNLIIKKYKEAGSILFYEEAWAICD